MPQGIPYGFLFGFKIPSCLLILLSSVPAPLVIPNRNDYGSAYYYAYCKP